MKIYKNILTLYIAAGFIFMGCAAKPIVSVTEEGLIAEFTENPKAASTKYKNTVLQIRGVITIINHPKSIHSKGFFELGFAGGANDHKISIACDFDRGDDTILNDLRIGDMVIVQANFVKYDELRGWKLITVRHSKVLEIIPQGETGKTDDKA